MATSAATLLTDIDLRYRNTFTAAQKCVWMNDEQNEISNLFKLDIGAVNFPLVAAVQFYPVPAVIEDVDQIRTATIQINDDPTFPEFVQLNYVRDGNSVRADVNACWYTIIADSLFINIPGGAVTDRQVYFYLDGAAEPITTGSSNVSIPRKYLEILKLGTLKRIAAARKDVMMRNAYEAERLQIIDDMLWTAQMSEPEFTSPADVMPRTGRNRQYNRAVWITQIEQG